MRAMFEEEVVGAQGPSLEVQILGLWLKCSGDSDGFVDLAIANSSESMARVRVRRVSGPVIAERLLRSRQERVRFAAGPGRYRIELETVGELDPESSREDWRSEIGMSVGGAARASGRAASHAVLVVG